MTHLDLRIATYNIRKAKGTDGRRDPDRIMRIVDGLGADIVALQEADLRLPPRRPVFDRTRLLQQTGLSAVEFDHGRESLGWHGNALLLSPRFRVERRAHHDLTSLEPRGLVEAVVRSDTGARLRILGVHLALLRSVRRRQLTHLLEMLAGNDNVPTVVLGDFNERSVTVGLGRLTRQFRLLDTEPTFHSRLPMLHLDRIAVTSAFEARAVRAMQTPETRRASDHLPLVADLRLDLSAAVTARPAATAMS